MSHPSEGAAPKVALERHSAPIVCIGYSAGGLEPLKEIFKSVGNDTGASFVVVAHLPRVGQTHLPELLRLWSGMPAELALDGLVLRPNRIYIIPPGDEIGVRDGFFARPRTKARGYSDVISIFLHSLAEHRHPPGIAVILSGLDADGAAAVGEFTQLGGIVLVQDPKTAEFPDMPRAAISKRCVDQVLAPKAIAPELRRIIAGIRRSGMGQAATD
jgi:chemotaxis response regulator CheB